MEARRNPKWDVGHSIDESALQNMLDLYVENFTHAPDYGSMLDPPLEMMFMANNPNGIREKLSRDVSRSFPGLQNHFPLPPNDFMCGALNSLIGLSPPGSRPDCLVTKASPF